MKNNTIKADTIDEAPLRNITKSKAKGGLGIKVSKSRNAVDCICEYFNKEVDDCVVEKLLLNAWFLSPFRDEATKLGTLNEDNVIQQLPCFFNRIQDQWKIVSIRQYGLLQSKQSQFCCCSPMLLKNSQRELVAAGLEIKTRTTIDKEREEKSIASHQDIGFCVEIDIVDEIDVNSNKAFAKCVPELNHRCQLIHMMASGCLKKAMIVYASKTAIIRVVFVNMGHNKRSKYILDAQWISERYLSWLYTDKIGENFKLSDYGHVKDFHTFQSNWLLFKKRMQLVKERGAPLPEGFRITPILISMWNRIKGGVDVYSRYLKDMKPIHKKLSPTSAWIIRLLLTCAYNAFQAYKTIKSADIIKTNISFTQYQKFRTSLITFADFGKLVAQSINIDDYINRSKDKIDSKSYNMLPESSIRLDKTLPHSCIRIKKSGNHREGFVSRCILCSELHQPHNKNKPRPGRQGFRSSFKCLQCKVTLCKQSKK